MLTLAAEALLEEEHCMLLYYFCWGLWWVGSGAVMASVEKRVIKSSERNMPSQIFIFALSHLSRMRPLLRAFT